MLHPVHLQAMNRMNAACVPLYETLGDNAVGVGSAIITRLPALANPPCFPSHHDALNETHCILPRPCAMRLRRWSSSSHMRVPSWWWLRWVGCD